MPATATDASSYPVFFKGETVLTKTRGMRAYISHMSNLPCRWMDHLLKDALRSAVQQAELVAASSSSRIF